MSAKYIKSQQYRVGRKMRSGYHFQDPIAHTKKDQVQDKQIVSLKKKVKKIQYDEDVKFIDYGAAATAVLETGVNLAGGGIAFGITQGDTDVTRDGDSIIATSLILRAQLYSDVDRIAFGNFVRVIVYWDKQPNGAVATVSGAAGSQSLMLASGAVPGHLDHRNQLTINRFDIIWDKTFCWNANTVQSFTPATGATTGLTQTSIAFQKRFKLNRKIRYLASAGAITDMIGNNLCVSVIGNSDTDPALISYNMRLYYKDP